MVARYRRASDEDRERMVHAFNNEEDFLSLAHTLGIKRTTAYSIITCYVKEGRSNSYPRRGGRTRVIDDETMDFIVLLLEAKPDSTLRELKETVRDEWPDKPNS